MTVPLVADGGAPAVEPPGSDPVWRRRPELVSWLAVLGAYLVYFLLADARAPVYDAWGYLDLSERIGSVFDPSSHDNVTRGYAYPWLLRVARTALSPLTDDISVVARVISLALVPAFLCVLVPAIARRLSTQVLITVPRLLVLNALFALAWRLDLLYPLSDIPALAFMALAVWLLLRSPGPAWALGAGVSFGLAVNTRPAYLLASLSAVGLLFLVDRGRRRIGLRMGLALLGIALALVPQVAANARYHDSTSPVPVGSSDLAQLQLTEGVRMLRYETYVGAPIPQGGPGLRFVNADLTEALDGRVRFESLGEYLRFVAEQPVGVTLAYGRHLFSGLDTRFGGTYIEHYEDGVTWASVLNTTVLVLAVASLVLRRMQRRVRQGIRWRSPGTWFAAVLAMSCGPALTGAIEPRFLLPLHLTLLAVFALYARPADIPTGLGGRVVAGGAVIASVAAIVAIDVSTLDTLPTPTAPPPAAAGPASGTYDEASSIDRNSS
jgi:hypothetical protein